MNEIKGVKYQMNEYSMIPNKCVVHCLSVRVLFDAKVCDCSVVTRFGKSCVHGECVACC